MTSRAPAHPDDDVRFYGVVPRSADAKAAFATARTVTRLSDEAGLDGVLYFTGTGAPLDPWAAAAATLGEHERLQPVIVVNPVYQHPYAAARMINSLSHLGGRSVAINLIAGTTLADLRAMGDTTPHDRRYDRLLEYATIVAGLLDSPRPFTFAGEFYSIERMQVLPPLPPELRPLRLLAGESPAAEGVARAVGALQLRMLQPDLVAPPDAPRPYGVHFGAIVRRDTPTARAAADVQFPPDTRRDGLFERSMENTDAVWKRHLATNGAGTGDPAYEIGPLRALQTDCPYLICGERRAHDIICSMVADGAHVLLVEVPPTPEDFEAVGAVVAMVRQTLRTGAMAPSSVPADRGVAR